MPSFWAKPCINSCIVILCICLCVFIVLIKIHVYVLSRKDWVLSKTGVTSPILPENVSSFIFGKILFIALVCYCFLDRLNPKVLKIWRG
jgi:hypothetical protein